MHFICNTIWFVLRLVSTDCSFQKGTGTGWYPNISSVWLHFTAYRCHGEIQQLKDGLLSTLNFGHLLATNPQAH